MVPLFHGLSLDFTRLTNQREDLSEKIVDKYYKVYVQEFFEQFLEDLQTDEKNHAWFKDSYSPQKIDEIFVAKQAIMKKRYKEFMEALTVHDHLRAINLEIDTSNLASIAQKSDELDNTIYEVFKDQPHVIPEYLANLKSNYSFFMICGVSKDTSFTDLYKLFEGNINFEGLNFNYAKKHDDFRRDFLLTWREANDKTAIEETLKAGGFDYRVLQIPSKSDKLYVKSFSSKDESAFHFLNVSRVGWAICQNFDINYAEFLNKVEDLEKTAQFNLTLLFLFKVFNFNYFSGKFYWNELRLGQREGGMLAHVNFDLPSDFDPTHESGLKEQANDPIFQLWIQQIEKSYQLIAHPDLLSKIEATIEVKLKDEFNNCHEGIWLCDICEKLFETQDFLVKHAKQRHATRCEKIASKYHDRAERQALFSDPFKKVYVDFNSVYLKYSLEKRNPESFNEDSQRARPHFTRSLIADYNNL